MKCLQYLALIVVICLPTPAFPQSLRDQYKAPFEGPILKHAFETSTIFLCVSNLAGSTGIYPESGGHKVISEFTKQSKPATWHLVIEKENALSIDNQGNQQDRADLEAILLADNAAVRLRFQGAFADQIQQFLDRSDRVCGQLRSFGRALSPDLRAAWVEAFVFSAFNSSFTSCHLLISGFPIPAGNLMRHYAEASAMALLCSHHAIDVVTRLDDDPTKFPVQKALQLVRKPRNAELLKINAKAWESFEAISKWYDQYSHASALSLATQTMRAAPGRVILGGEFDDGKCAQYRKELRLRVSAMARLYDLAAAAQENAKVAQARELFERKRTAG